MCVCVCGGAGSSINIDMYIVELFCPFPYFRVLEMLFWPTLMLVMLYSMLSVSHGHWFGMDWILLLLLLLLL